MIQRARHRPTNSQAYRGCAVFGCTHERPSRTRFAAAISGRTPPDPDGHWWIYADQLVSNDVQVLRRENAQLRQRVEETVGAEGFRRPSDPGVGRPAGRSDARRVKTANELATALAMLELPGRQQRPAKRAAEGSRRAVDGLQSRR